MKKVAFTDVTRERHTASNSPNLQEIRAKPEICETRSQAVARIADSTASQQAIYIVISDCC